MSLLSDRSMAINSEVLQLKQEVGDQKARGVILHIFCSKKLCAPLRTCSVHTNMRRHSYCNKARSGHNGQLSRAARNPSFEGQTHFCVSSQHETEDCVSNELFLENSTAKSCEIDQFCPHSEVKSVHLNGHTQIS